MAYKFIKRIVIDGSKVPSTQTDFPVLVSGTYAYLKTTANGGSVTNSNGYDIAFYSDLALTTQLKHETDTWDGTTGAVNYWVKIPALNGITNTIFYITYNDSTITTDQSDKVNVWDSNYKTILHLGDGTTLSISDSTSNSTSTTNLSATAGSGEIGGSASFSGASQSIKLPTYVIPTTAGTVSAWIYVADISIDSPIFCSRKFGPLQLFDFYPSAFGGGNFYTGWYNNGDDDRVAVSFSGNLSNNTWTNLVCSWTNSGVISLYINGVLKGIIATLTATWDTSGNDAYLGFDSTGVKYLDGKIDEFRMSDVVRTQNWITTEYNNQNSPSTFYTVENVSQIKGISSITRINSITF